MTTTTDTENLSGLLARDEDTEIMPTDVPLAEVITRLVMLKKLDSVDAGLAHSPKSLYKMLNDTYNEQESDGESDDEPDDEYDNLLNLATEMVKKVYTAKGELRAEAEARRLANAKATIQAKKDAVQALSPMERMAAKGFVKIPGLDSAAFVKFYGDELPKLAFPFALHGVNSKSIYYAALLPVKKAGTDETAPKLRWTVIHPADLAMYKQMMAPSEVKAQLRSLAGATATVSKKVATAFVPLEDDEPEQPEADAPATPPPRNNKKRGTPQAPRAPRARRN